MSPSRRPPVDDSRDGGRAWERFGETRPPLFSPETRELLSSPRSTSVVNRAAPGTDGSRRSGAPGRAAAERRRSVRWKTEATLHWRVQGGRRLRESRLVERSLDGLVILARAGDVPEVGQSILAAGVESAVRLGFRSAVVRRTKPDGEGGHLIVAEILS